MNRFTKQAATPEGEIFEELSRLAAERRDEDAPKAPSEHALTAPIIMDIDSEPTRIA